MKTTVAILLSLASLASSSAFAQSKTRAEVYQELIQAQQDGRDLSPTPRTPMSTRSSRISLHNGSKRNWRNARQEANKPASPQVRRTNPQSPSARPRSIGKLLGHARHYFAA